MRSPGASPSSSLRLPHLIRHRHRRHEALDLFVLDDEVLDRRIERLDLTLQREAALVGSPPQADGERAGSERQNETRM